MTNPELLSFIEKELTVGMLPDKIRETLATAGWNSADVEQAFSSLSMSVPVSTPVASLTESPSNVVTATQTTLPKNGKKINVRALAGALVLFLVLLVVTLLAAPIILGLLYKDTAALSDVDLALPTVAVPEADNSFSDFVEAAQLARLLVEDTASSTERESRKQALYAALSSAFKKNGYQNPSPAEQEYGGLSNLVAISNGNARALAKEGKSAEAIQAAVVGVMLGSRMERSQESLLGISTAMRLKQESLSTIHEVNMMTKSDSKEHIRLAEWLGTQKNNGSGLVHAHQFEYQTIGKQLPQAPSPPAVSSTTPKVGASLATLLKNSPWNATHLYFFPNETNGYIQSHVRRLMSDAKASCATYPGDEASSQSEQAMFSSLANKPWEWPVAANVYGKLLFSAYSTAAKSTVKTSACNGNMSLGGVQLVLAITAFEQDKKVLPQTLSELVPDYLQALPTDPWSDAGYVYVPARRAVYSVGPLHKDTGGVGAENPSFAF